MMCSICPLIFSHVSGRLKWLHVMDERTVVGNRKASSCSNVPDVEKRFFKLKIKTTSSFNCTPQGQGVPAEMRAWATAQRSTSPCLLPLAPGDHALYVTVPQSVVHLNCAVGFDTSQGTFSREPLGENRQSAEAHATLISVLLRVCLHSSHVELR